MTKTRNQYSTSVYQSKAVVLAIMLALLSLALIPSAVTSFHIPPSRCSPILPTSAAPIDDRRFQRSVFLNAENTPMSEQELKERLTEYLAKRKEANADEAAQEIKGKVVGGTRNNVVLEYISGAPVKEKMIDRAPNVFDYDELSRYGYSNLVEPIMDMVGGRRAVYELMDMEPPPLVGPPKRKKVPELKIDRTGEDDKARYTGLKMGQVLDDDMMAEALARANEKAKEGKELRPALMEESYVQPFAGTYSIGEKSKNCVPIVLVLNSCIPVYCIYFDKISNFFLMDAFTLTFLDCKSQTSATRDPRKLPIGPPNCWMNTPKRGAELRIGLAKPNSEHSSRIRRKPRNYRRRFASMPSLTPSFLPFPLAARHPHSWRRSYTLALVPALRASRVSCRFPHLPWRWQL